jgi:hypothetical protein
MKIEGQTENYICADGKFFTLYDYDEKGAALYRQIECYLPAAEGTYGEPLAVTMQRKLDAFEQGKDWRWAIGSTGSLLTARYQVRESDGELVSLLTLSGGMKK